MLSSDEAEKLATQLDESWERDSNSSIKRTFIFRDFSEAFALATRIALLANEEGHHPDLAVGWGRLTVSLTTHVAKGLTENDFIMAAKIDQIAA